MLESEFKARQHALLRAYDKGLLTWTQAYFELYKLDRYERLKSPLSPKQRLDRDRGRMTNWLNSRYGHKTRKGRTRQ